MKNLKYFIVMLLVLAPAARAQEFVFRILVAYSLDYLDSNATNPLLPVQNCVQYANNVFEEYPDDMLGQIRMELVYAYRSNYREHFSVFVDRTRMTNPNDGFLDELVSPSGGLRERYKADICVLAIGRSGTNKDASGVAYICASRDSAHCVALIKPHIYAPILIHEIGHLFGARHENDPNSTPYPFAHAYEYQNPANRVLNPHDPGNPTLYPYWTIMCHGVANFRTRNRFSTPDIRMMDGNPGALEVVGDAAWRDVSRLMRGRMDGTEDRPPPHARGPIGDYRTTADTMTLQNDTVLDYELRMPIATNTITITNGFTVHRNGCLTVRITPTPLGKAAAQTDKSIGLHILQPAELQARLIRSAGKATVYYTAEEGHPVSIRILTVSGQLLLESNLGKGSGLEQKFVIENTSLPSGRVLLEVRAGNNSFKRSFVNAR